MGIDSNITAEQKEVLTKVRDSVADLLTPEHDDEYILRFIIARKYDVDSSVQMLKRHLLYWKKHNFYELFRTTMLEKKTSYFLTALLGYDKEGSLVRLLKIGQSDLKGLILSHSPNEAVMIASYLLHQDTASQKKRRATHGDGLDCKMSYIIDLQGLPWSCLFSRPLISYFIVLLRTYETNFPEQLKMAYIVNAPSFINVILNFAKNVLPADVCNKIAVVNDPKQTFGCVMEESILPGYLGGTLMGPENDPACTHLFPVVPGTPVPEEYYLETKTLSLSGDPDIKKALVLNQSSFSVELEVKDPKSKILWDFETVDNDIGIGLRYKAKPEDEFEILLPIRRVNSHRFTESGRYDCEKCGTYELLFDNTYSWWARKELIYKVSIEANNTSTEEIL